MIGIPLDSRPLGTYIAGNPGTGKSSLIQRMALEDIIHGNGVCVVDPTADLVNKLIHHIPQSRVKDTIYFDTTLPVAIDFFSYHDAKDQEILIDDIVQIFDVATAKRAKPLLITLLYTLFEANEAGGDCTFLDIGHFLMDDDRKKAILKDCSLRRRKYWETTRINPEVLDTITSRVIPFMESATLTAILGSPTPTIKIWDVMEKKQILFVNIEDSPTDLFIASLIVSKFQQCAFRRRKAYPIESQRVLYYLYIDECHTIIKFAVESFDRMLTRARKFKLCLTLANQIPEDLPEPIRNKLGTLGNLVLFNLDEQNARIFKTRVLPYDYRELTNLDKFCALFRTGNRVRRVKTQGFLPPSPASYAGAIRTRSKPPEACNLPEKQHTSDNGKPHSEEPKEAPKEISVPPDRRKFAPKHPRDPQ